MNKDNQEVIQQLQFLLRNRNDDGVLETSDDEFESLFVSALAAKDAEIEKEYQRGYGDGELVSHDDACEAAEQRGYEKCIQDVVVMAEQAQSELRERQVKELEKLAKPNQSRVQLDEAIKIIRQTK